MKKTLYTWLSALLIFTLLQGCIDDPDPQTGRLNARGPIMNISVDEIKATAITFTITVEDEGGAPVIQWGICWSSETSPTIANDTLIAGKGKGSFKVTVGNLIPEREYNFRAFGTNIATTGYSALASVPTIKGLGTVRTLKPVDLTATSAECGGKIESSGEIEIIERGVILKDLSLEPDDPAAIITTVISMETDSFYCTVSDLKPATQYYVEAYVKDKLDRLFFHSNGLDSVKFITPKGLPEIGLVTVKEEYNSAILNAEILSEGDDVVIEKGFLFGITENLEIDGESLKVEGDKFEYEVKPLKAYEKYYVRAYATNRFGTTQSELISFYTKSDVPIMSLEQISLENGAVTLNVKLESQGQSPVTETGICWNTQPGADKDVNGHVVLIEHNKEAEYVLEGIVGGQTYYIYAYGVNEHGIGYASTPVSFTAPDRFTTKATPIGDVKQAAASFVIDNRIYLVGGDDGNGYSNQAVTYNPIQNTWSKFAAFPEQAKELMACASDEIGYVMGGKGSDGMVNNFYSYDVWTNEWSLLGVMPEIKHGAISILTPGLKGLYVVGGASNDVYLYTYLSTNPEWWSENIPKFPENISNGIYFEYDGKLYVGLGSTQVLSSISIYDGFISAPWSSVRPKESKSLPKSVSTAVVHNDTVYMIDNNGVIWDFNLETLQLNRRGTFPGARMFDYHMFLLQDTIYILGQGIQGGSVFITYDPVWDPVTD